MWFQFSPKEGSVPLPSVLVCGTEPSVVVSCPGGGQELVAVLNVCAWLGYDKSRKQAESSAPWLRLSIPALLGAKESSHRASCTRRESVSLVSWVPHTNELQSVPHPMVRRREHAICSCGKDCIWRLGTYPAGESILVVLDLCRLFWHYLCGGSLYFGCCNARYVWLRTISVPPDLLFAQAESCERHAPFSLQPLGPRLWLKDTLLGLLVFILSSLSPHSCAYLDISRRTYCGVSFVS